MSKQISHADSADILNDMVSQTDFSKGKTSDIFKKLQTSKRIVVLKNNKPSAILLSPDEYARLAEDEENLRLLLLAEKRLEESNGKSISFEEILKEDNLSLDDLRALSNDVEIE